METRNDNTIRNRAGRTISDLVMAELFFVQATIESASALGDSISELREQLSANGANSEREELVSFLKRTRDQLVEPYTTRYRFFRDLVQEEDKDAA